MKGFIIRWVLALLAIGTAIFLYCTRTISYDKAEMLDELVQEKQYISYSGVKNDSDIIAIVKITDELTNKNSELSYYENGNVKDFWSSRKAEVVKVYKNETDKDFGGNVEIMEHMGIGKNGICHKARLDKPMLKDNKYLVFIKADDDGSFRLISQEGGKHNLDGSAMNSEICLNFILEYELTEKSELAEKIKTLHSYVDMCGPIVDKFYPDEIIKTNVGDIIVQKADLSMDEKFYYYVVRMDGDFKFNHILSNL